MAERKVHYSGGLRVQLRSGAVVKVERGWAACCSGSRCLAVRERGDQTELADKVTCKRCLYLRRLEDKQR